MFQKPPPGSQGLNPQPKLLIMRLDQRFPWLWALILAFMVTQSSPKYPPQIPSITDPKFIEDCVKIHNELRSDVEPVAGNMRYMTWDAALAKSARGWARKCIFKHNIHLSQKNACHPIFHSIGENLWIGPLTEYLVRNATTDWFDESKYFSLDINRCLRPCLHFAQVVWASTYKVGCALRSCPNLGKHIVIFVCNYSPAGNVAGMAPYATASSCTLCEDGDTCENKQCKNPKRDRILRYPYWNPKWEFPRHITCNPFCQICVSFRMIGIALAIIGITMLQRKYPHMHLKT
ncbi:GLIPR1-like protein 1 [Petaurus breviceps papuanus]|uniref:GLIPR1-like protein 1 n=1 Tax=Petaurus breviceps papuanus TaxID=3040969 RepID=UPI0036D938C5